MWGIPEGIVLGPKCWQMQDTMGRLQIIHIDSHEAVRDPTMGEKLSQTVIIGGNAITLTSSFNFGAFEFSLYVSQPWMLNDHVFHENA